MKTITFSTPSEAVQKARLIFDDPDEDFVLATGDESVGGVYWEGTRGDLLLHRSFKAVWFTGDVEAAKNRLLGIPEPTPPAPYSPAR